MNFEPGPLDPLDQAAIAAGFSPAFAVDLTSDAIDQGDTLAGTAAALDQVAGELAAAGAPDDAGLDVDQLAQTAADAATAAVSDAGQVDPAIAGTLDGAAVAVQQVNDDMVDAPDQEQAATAIVPQDYMAIFDFSGTGKPWDQLTPEEQALRNTIPGGDLSLLPEPGSGKQPNP